MQLLHTLRPANDNRGTQAARGGGDELQQAGLSQSSAETPAILSNTAAHFRPGLRRPRRHRLTMDGGQPSSRARSAFFIARSAIANDNACIPSDNNTLSGSPMTDLLVPGGTGVNWHVDGETAPLVPFDTMGHERGRPSTLAERLAEAIADAQKQGALPSDPLGTIARGVNERAGTRWAGGYVGRILRGERGGSIQPEAVFALADTLAVEARWLWLGQGPKHAAMRRAGGDR